MYIQYIVCLSSIVSHPCIHGHSSNIYHFHLTTHSRVTFEHHT